MLTEEKEKLNTKSISIMIERELYDWIMQTKNLNKLGMRIFHAIVRQTNGYYCKTALMSYKYFEVLTGINHSDIDVTLKNLLDKEIIFRYRGPEDKFGKPAYYYSINKKRCRLPNNSTENNTSPNIKLTPIPAVEPTPIKDSNTIYKKEAQTLVDKCKNFKLHYAEEKSSSNENKKDDSKTENCGSKKK
jgi:hypothetical protein